MLIKFVYFLMFIYYFGWIFGFVASFFVRKTKLFKPFLITSICWFSLIGVSFSIALYRHKVFREPQNIIEYDYENRNSEVVNVKIPFKGKSSIVLKDLNKKEYLLFKSENGNYLLPIGNYYLYEFRATEKDESGHSWIVWFHERAFDKNSKEINISKKSLNRSLRIGPPFKMGFEYHKSGFATNDYLQLRILDLANNKYVIRKEKFFFKKKIKLSIKNKQNNSEVIDKTEYCCLGKIRYKNLKKKLAKGKYEFKPILNLFPFKNKILNTSYDIE